MTTDGLTTSGPWQRAVLGAGSLGSRRPAVAGVGLGFVALACVLLAAARPAEVVAAIEASEAPEGASPAVPGDPSVVVGPDGTARPTAAAAKARYATPDELDAADSPEKMVALGEAYPEDPAVLKRLAIAQAGKSDHSAAIRTVRKLARIAPTAAADDAIQQVVVRAAGSTPEVMELAFELMQEGMGPAGPDLLYALATTTQTAKTPRERADKALANEKVRAVGTPALRIAVDLRTTKSSCARKPLFARARDEGDGRSLPFLTPLLATSGCGFLSTGDCHKCLGGRADLREAISSIQTREKSGN